jgi:hypothetical protein
LFGVPYEAGSFIDKLIEAFGGRMIVLVFRLAVCMSNKEMQREEDQKH